MERIEHAPARISKLCRQTLCGQRNTRSAQWYILAYRGSPEEGLFSIAIANGQIVQEKPSFNVGELFKNPSPIAIERIDD